jgi:tetratricopeptide (TPR) repeat protein
VRRLRFALLAVALTIGCAPTNFVELAAQQEVNERELHEPANQIEAAHTALLGRHDRDLATRLFRKALAASVPELRAQAALGLAYLGVLDGRPELVHQAVEVGLSSVGPSDAELFLSVLRSYWGTFTKSGPVPPTLEQSIRDVMSRSGDAWICARQEAAEQLQRAAQLNADPTSWHKAAKDTGLITGWLISAPWGLDPFADMQRELGPEKRALTRIEQLTLGYLKEERASWFMRATHGEVFFYDLPRTGGVGFAQTYLRLPANIKDRRVLISAESNRPLRVFANGVELARLHQGDEASGWSSHAVLDLPDAGALLSVKLGSDDGSGFFRVRAFSYSGEPVVAWSGPESNVDGGLERLTAAGGDKPVKRSAPRCLGFKERQSPRFPDGHGVIRALLSAEILNGRPHRHTDESRRVLRHLSTVAPQFPGLLAMEARLLANDGALGSSLSRGKRRTLAKRLTKRWKDHVPSLNLLAKLQWTDSLVNEAIETWKRALSFRPNDVPTLIALLNATSKKGWRNESLKVARHLETLPTSGPRVMQEVFDSYRRFGQSRDAERVSKTLSQLFPYSAITRRARQVGDRADGGPSARAALLLTLWDERPDRLDVARKAFELFLAGGKLESAAKVLERLGQIRPDDLWTKKAWLALSVAGDGKVQLSKALQHVMKASRGEPRMERLAHWLSGTTGALSRLQDGREILATFLAEQKGKENDPYSAYPIVNILDRMDAVVMPDGTVWTLTHVVRLVQTKSGVDRIGEISPPRGSSLLELRTIKANGDILWPERVAGKDDISFSGLKPGDAVEWAWITRDEVRKEEGGYLTGITFSQWGIPTRFKRASVELAPNLNLVLRLRNAAPTPKVTALGNGSTRFFWEESDLPPIPREPRSATARVFFPFVDLAIAPRERPTDVSMRDSDATWRRIREAYTGRLNHLLRRGWRVEERVSDLRKAGAKREQLQAASRWVQGEVKGTERFNRFQANLEQALARGKGNRSLVFSGLARALEFETTLLLCAPEPHGPPADGDDPIPNANRYWYPIVRVMVDSSPIHVDVSDANTPFGTMPASLHGAKCMAMGDDRSPLFTRLPDRSNSERSWRLVLTVDVDKEGGTRLEFHGQGQGASTNALRQVYGRSDTRRRRLIWQQWVNWMVPGARLVDFEVSGADDPEDDFRFRVRASAGGLFVRQGKNLVAEKIVGSLWAQHFSTFPALNELVTLAERDTPLHFEHHSEEFQLILRATEGFTLKTSMKNGSFQTLGGHIRAGQEVANGVGTLTLTRWLEAKGAIVPSEEYPTFRTQVLEMDEATGGAFRVIPVLP